MLSRVAAGLAAASMTIASRLRLRARLGVIVQEPPLTGAQAREHVDALARWFELIHHDQLEARLRRPAARPFCLVTFDGGKRSIAVETAPALERLGVPAVFYLSTGRVGRDLPEWRERWAALKRRLGGAPPGLEEDVVTQLPLALLEERLDRACARHGIVVAVDRDHLRSMSWSEARALAARGFTIGAQGVRHALLPRETEAVALDEISRSLTDVTNELGAPCRTFAFPGGSYTARLAQHACERGAQTVMTTEPTWVGAASSWWRLPRVQLRADMTRASLELRLAAAATGRILENPNGTGRSYRALSRLRQRRPPRR